MSKTPSNPLSDPTDPGSGPGADPTDLRPLVERELADGTWFAHVADVHLKPLIWAARPEIAGDAYAAWDYLTNWIAGHGMNLLLTGDVFNSTRPDATDTVVFRRGVDRVLSSGGEVFAILGNHDAPDRQGSNWLTLDDRIQYVDGRLFEPVPGLMAYGLDYRRAGEITQQVAACPPRATLLALHQMIDLAAPVPGAFNLAAEAVPGHVRHVLLGDDHHPRTLLDPRGMPFTYPGSTSLQSMSEPASKFFNVCRKLDDGRLLVRQVPIPSRPVHRFRLLVPGQLDSLLNRLPRLVAADPGLPETIRTPILEMAFDPEIGNVRDAVVETLASIAGDKQGDRPLAHLFFRAVKADSVAAEPSQGTSAATDPAEVLAELLEGPDNAQLLDFTTGLLEAPDPRAYLQAMAKAYHFAAAQDLLLLRR